LQMLKASWSAVVWAVVAWMVVRPLYGLVTNRMVIAPAWMQPWESGNDERTLELRRDAEVGRNVIYLSRYTARCAECDGTVYIRSGRRDFPGRLVGRCDRVPTEHVFTFDPVRRIGKPLR